MDRKLRVIDTETTNENSIKSFRFRGIVFKQTLGNQKVYRNCFFQLGQGLLNFPLDSWNGEIPLLVLRRHIVFL